MSRLPILSSITLLTFAVPTAALALPPQQFAPSRNSTGTAQIVLPAIVTKLNDMDFGFVTVTTAGTAVLDSNSGAMTTTGGVLFMGGLPHAAQFAAVSPSKTVVHIMLPKQPATLTRIGGTETMTIDTWTINGNATRNVVAHELFAFSVGGTLHVNANQVEGTYAGTFSVTFNYN
jgi:hypothetical protein